MKIKLVNRGFPMILEIFKDSLEYSFKEPESILKLGILSFFSSLIIPFFFLQGYSYRVTKIGVNGMINGDDPLPKFENFISLFVEGITLVIVRFIYMLPGTILFLILFPTAILSMTLYPGVPSLFIGLGVIALCVVLWLISYLFSIIAIPNMINNNGSFKAAFNISEILAIAKSIGIYKYIKFYIACIVLILGIVATVALLIPLSGLILGLIFSPLSGFSAFGYSFGISGVTISIFAVLLISPFFMVFESRAIALMYNMRTTTNS
jgi:hypothetical protein